ncbi:hypothetical protein SPH27_22860, partial [Enterobacter sp. A103]|nr:hypothetical protein [Enterobacter sp. A103]
MKIKNGPVLCPYCGCLSAYYEIDKLSALREKNGKGHLSDWDNVLRNYT